LTEGYFKCLLLLPDLAALHARPDVNTLTDKQWHRLARGLDVEPCALADSREDDIDMEEAALQILDEEPPADLLGGPLPSMAIESVRCDGLVCHYDNFTHTSGMQRAFVTCGIHHKCEKYAFLHRHPSPLAAAAYLFAWQGLGVVCDNRQTHYDSIPAEEDVQAWLRKLQK